MDGDVDAAESAAEDKDPFLSVSHKQFSGFYFDIETWTPRQSAGGGAF
jgi:hypothetical protein